MTLDLTGLPLNDHKTPLDESLYFDVDATSLAAASERQILLEPRRAADLEITGHNTQINGELRCLQN